MFGLSLGLFLFAVFGCRGMGGLSPRRWGERSPGGRVTLERIGPEDATVGVIPLPLPREGAERLSIAHPNVGLQPVAWWEKDHLPRRAMAYIVDSSGVPEELQLEEGRRPGRASDTWTVRYKTTLERLPFKNVRDWSYEALRGYPAADCTLVEGEVQLTYGGRTLSLQCGATGPQEGSRGPDGVYWWQNVQVERLWANRAAQAVRIGGIIYNSDTFLWGDVYLLLFRNGVARASVHFVNTRLAIDGYDFQGLPVVRLRGDFGGRKDADLALPRDGMRQKVGWLDLNFNPAGHLCSEEYPGSLKATEDELRWRPVSRTFNPRKPDAPPTEWMKGYARTMPFAFSLSDSAPVLARYRAPAWWYAQCGELSAWDYLPVKGRLSTGAMKTVRKRLGKITRGRFDAGASGFDDGAMGENLMRAYYRSGEPELLDGALTYCVYWTDIMVDHDDHTVHQHAGWPYKTCAYTKFSDILYAWLETGDPYFLDNLEMTAEGYWAWFRSNWPRNSIGRDDFGMGDWALMWRYLDSAHARERTLELLRMNRAVLQQRGDNVGGQMGAGPHPGYHPSLYMSGVAMLSMLDVAETALEKGLDRQADTARKMVRRIDAHFMRDDVACYPSAYGEVRSEWRDSHHAAWSLKAWRIYPTLARMGGGVDDLVLAGLRKAHTEEVGDPAKMADQCRDATRLVDPCLADMLLLGARYHKGRLELNPIGDLALWSERQIILSPFGPVRVSRTLTDQGALLRFSCQEDVPLRVNYRGQTERTTTNGSCTLERR